MSSHAMIPMGTTLKKRNCQPRAVPRSPDRPGPSDRPLYTPMEVSPSTLPSCSGGAQLTRIASAQVFMMAVPIACTKRQHRNSQMFVTNGSKADMTTNRDRPLRKSRLRPTMSPTRPATRWKIASDNV